MVFLTKSHHEEVLVFSDYFGEPGGARTRDHRIKSAMLYQLSYRLLEDVLDKLPGGGPALSG